MEIRALAPEEMEATRDIRARAFGPLTDAEWEGTLRRTAPVLAAGRQFAGFDGDRIVATGRIHDMIQWWHGRAVSMGGIGGITVAPEERGRGLGRRLMTEMLERCAGFGHAVSMLYPATTRIYRSLGWEHAGAQHEIELPAEALRGIAAERVPVRRAGPGDAAEVAAVIGRVHASARDCGPIGWHGSMWPGFLDDRDGYCYLAEDGFLAYRWAEGNTALEVVRAVAASERTLRALWAIVGSGSSTASTVKACVSPMDPVLWLPGEREKESVGRKQWMLRVVDAPAAIEARGYPEGVAVAVPLEIDDPQRPGNSGHWRLEVKDGEGRLERSGEDAAAVRMGARGLSALYAGVPVSTLRRVGLLAGGDAGALSAAFAATPYSLDYF
ncbi:GNAT family N-acetyltransferase [Actinomadura sp. LD22]|uniref:GNAT family N-acetyltransferase n=1 Tax=Actinomadura physcomitrii TaxID=2650748 RepID=A0A6I4MJS5_9ACTN|nr:GNAT family N-acetyltransferase [Actinomadura physcomitrii]MWA06438.1 GNAT family N-acetyltransferase [Actinomadura physcomitrii]